MRVLLISPFYEPAWGYGGMARASAELARALVRRGHEVQVVTARLHPAHPARETGAGVRVERFSSPRLLQRFLFPWPRGVEAFLREAAPSFDIAHVAGHRHGLAVAAARALKAAGVPWILQPHGTFPHHGQWVLLKRLFDGLYGALVVGGAARLVALSQAEAADLPRPAQVIPNGVELPEAAPDDGPRRVPTRLLFVGTGASQKRGHLLPGLLAALPQAELQLAGRFGPRFLRRFAPCRGRVLLSGVLSGEALLQAYRGAGVVVHPAVGESFGLVPFEAALCGAAAVVAGGHGCGEWFGLAGGCVIPPDQPEALVAAARERMADPGLARREAEAVAAFARSRLRWEAVAAGVEALYAEVLARPAARPA